MASKNTVLIIGQLPPTITGQSLVTEEVYNILVEHGAKIKVHNLVYSDYKYFVKYFVLIKILVFISLDIISCKSVIYLSASRTLIGFYRNAYIILLGSFFKRKIIIHFHCGEYNDFVLGNGFLFKKIAKWLFRLVDTSIILGKSLTNNYTSIFNEKMEIIVIPNGVSIKENLNLNSNDAILNILYMSNLIESKGYFDILEAINILVNDYKIINIRVDFCGKFLDHEDNLSFKTVEEYISYFNDFVYSNNLNKFINYHKVVTGVTKDLLLQNCDIFILPTYYSTEAQPLSILEALSYGKIVISTNHRGIPDMVINGYNGLIVGKKSPKSIADAILKLVNDESLQKKMSLNSKIHVENNFSFEIFERNIVHLFNKYQSI